MKERILIVCQCCFPWYSGDDATMKRFEGNFIIKVRNGSLVIRRDEDGFLLTPISLTELVVEINDIQRANPRKEFELVLIDVHNFPAGSLDDASPHEQLQYLREMQHKAADIYFQRSGVDTAEDGLVVLDRKRMIVTEDAEEKTTAFKD